MKLLVTGTKGQVASSLAALSGHDALEIVCVGRPELDLADAGNIAEIIERTKPDVVVNAAAWTAVDAAETSKEAAFAVNADGAEAVAKAAADAGLPIIQVSTDYVFRGDKTDPYVETDSTGPIGVYGASKLEGEQRVAAANPRHAILRTAWVYSHVGANFLKTMLRVGRDRPELKVVDDQHGSPTHADAIAAGIVKVARNLVKQDVREAYYGVFHMSCAGEASWYDFAVAIFEDSAGQAGPSPKVTAITTAEYPTPTARPANSRLNCEKIARVHGVTMPHWRDPVAATVAKVLAVAD